MTSLPTSIQLSAAEAYELSVRIFAASRPGATPTVAAFWRGVFHARGIIIPAKRHIPVATPLRDGAYTLSWQTTKLGPKALAEGEKYRKFQEEREAKYEREKGFRL